MTNYPLLLTEATPAADWSVTNHADYLGYILLGWVTSLSSILPTPCLDHSTRLWGQPHSSFNPSGSLALLQATLWHIHSAISSQDLWLGAMLSLSSKVLMPCIEAMAISKLYLADQKASRMAWDRANGSESTNTLLDSALISWARICKASELWSLWVGGRSEHWGWSGSKIEPFSSGHRWGKCT